MIGRVVSVSRKEFRELVRDPITLWIAVVLPLVMLVVFGYAIRLEVEDVRMAVVDHDRTAESARFVEAFTNTGHFVVHHRPDHEDEAGRLLDRGAVRIAVVIPEGFARELGAGRTAPAQTLIDGSYAATARILKAEVEAVTLTFARREAPGDPGARREAHAHIRDRTRVWYNPELRSETFVVSGLFAVILMAFPPLLTALAVVREKESGSVEQIYVSPLRPWEFIAGKMSAYVIVAFLELVLILGLGRWWFDVPFRGGPVALLLGSILFVLCTVGVGLLVSTVTRSQVVAVLLALIVTVMPSFLFSGFMFPITSMTEPVQWYTRIFPARYFMEISRGAFLKGVGLTEQWDQLGVLAAYTAVVFAAASLRFRKKIA